MNVLSAFRSLALFSLSVNSTEQRLMRSHLELFSREHVWGKNEENVYVLQSPNFQASFLIFSAVTLHDDHAFIELANVTSCVFSVLYSARLQWCLNWRSAKSDVGPRGQQRQGEHN